MTQIDPKTLDERVALFTAVFRKNRIKITPQRLEIFRQIASSSNHPTADSIHHRIIEKMPTVSLDTVYRTLTTLQANGVIKRVEILDDSARFDANLHKHHHLVCEKCKKVEDINWGEFDALKLPPSTEKWGVVKHPYAELRGICKECLEKSY